MEEALKEYDLHVEQSEAEDKEPIDFLIKDRYGGIWAVVWGSEPWDDIQIECNHPAVEYEDDEHVGVCPICGATCTWHWEIFADGDRSIKDKTEDQWENPEKIGGIVGDYLRELQKRW